MRHVHVHGNGRSVKAMMVNIPDRIVRHAVALDTGKPDSHVNMSELNDNEIYGFLGRYMTVHGHDPFAEAARSSLARTDRSPETETDAIGRKSERSMV